MPLLDRLTPRKIEILRQLCAGKPTEQIAAEHGLAPASVVSMRNMILNRTPNGMSLRDVCVAAAEEDPTIVVSPDIEKWKGKKVRTSR